jgi:phosphatidylserine/phosphatidylglycerophosphate/cardiolipin synthase-like enzyme
MTNRGWNYADGTHVKYFDTDGKVVLITGRGHSGTYLKWLDTAWTFKDPLLVADAQRVFENIWERLLVENPPRPPREGDLPYADSDEKSPRSLKAIEQIFYSLPSEPGPLRSKNADEPFEELMRWIKEDTFQHPGGRKGMQVKVRVLHNEFFAQMKEKFIGRPSQYSTEERERLIEDSILESVIDSVNRARRHVRFWTFATIMNPKFKKSLIDAKQRGVDVRILTNSKNAHSVMASGVLAGQSGWYNFGPYLDHRDKPTCSPEGDVLGKCTDYCKEVATKNIRIPCLAAGHFASIEDLDDLLRARIPVYGLSVTDEFEYVHRKMLEADDELYFGSHNLTVASTTMQEEVNFQVVSPEWAEWARIEFARNSHPFYSLPFIPAEVSYERSSTLLQNFSLNGWRRWFAKKLIFMF